MYLHNYSYEDPETTEKRGYISLRRSLLRCGTLIRPHAYVVGRALPTAHLRFSEVSEMVLATSYTTILPW